MAESRPNKRVNLVEMGCIVVDQDESTIFVMIGCFQPIYETFPGMDRKTTQRFPSFPVSATFRWIS